VSPFSLLARYCFAIVSKFSHAFLFTGVNAISNQLSCFSSASDKETLGDNPSAKVFSYLNNDSVIAST